MKKYRKYEFCKAIKCEGLRGMMDNPCCPYYPEHCLKTAKEFHEWLQQNLFIIVQPENEYEASNL